MVVLKTDEGRFKLQNLDEFSGWISIKKSRRTQPDAAAC
jgi:hypothetical protein